MRVHGAQVFVNDNGSRRLHDSSGLPDMTAVAPKAVVKRGDGGDDESNHDAYDGARAEGTVGWRPVDAVDEDGEHRGVQGRDHRALPYRRGRENLVAVVRVA